MEGEKLNREDFRKEIMDMVESCTGLKPSTAKRKANNILKKYRPIICYSTNFTGEYYEKKYEQIKVRFEILKQGYINYYKGGTRGKLLLKDIEQIEIIKSVMSKDTIDVLLITKTGRQINMGPDFEYLIDLI
jgi:hypothetical protein